VASANEVQTNATSFSEAKSEKRQYSPKGRNLLAQQHNLHLAILLERVDTFLPLGFGHGTREMDESDVLFAQVAINKFWQQSDTF
jgi:hypothetical protein